MWKVLIQKLATTRDALSNGTGISIFVIILSIYIAEKKVGFDSKSKQILVHPNLHENKLQCSILVRFSTTLSLHYRASSMKLSPPWLHNSTEHPKLIYMKISCSTHNLGQIDLKCYEHVLGASEMDKGLRLTQFGLNWSKNF